MDDEEARFKIQEQFGRAYNDDDFIIFNVAVRYPETVVSNRLEPRQEIIVNTQLGE